MNDPQDFSGSLVVICVCVAGVIALGLYAAARDAAVGIPYWTSQRVRVLAAVGLSVVIYGGFVVIAVWMDPGPVAARSEAPQHRPASLD